MKITSILVGLALSTAILSCKKDSDSTSSVASADRATALKAGGKSWKLTAATVSPAISFGGVTVTDIYANETFTPACTKDDLTKFSDGGSYTEDEGATKCKSGDPQTKTGSWALIDSNNKLRMIEGGDTTTITIISMTASEVKGSMSMEQGGTTYTVTSTMKTQ